MYVIIVYDVGVDRVNKVRSFLRQYLKWVQNSVFEGELTNAELVKTRDVLQKIVNSGDSIIIYKLRTADEIKREIIGSEKSHMGVVI